MKFLQGMSVGAVVATVFLLYGTLLIFLYHYFGINGLLLALVLAWIGLRITFVIMKVPKQ